MNSLIDVSCFELIKQVDDHIFELFTYHTPPENQDLGYVDRRSESIDITLHRSNIDLSISQSLTELSSTKETSSTGFVCWKSAVYFTDWLLSDERCPFYLIFRNKSSLKVLELGTGVAGICVSLLGPLVGTYTATDQKHILKLLKQNFETNAGTQKYTSTTLKRPPTKHTNPPRIEFIEFDWEDLDNAMYNCETLGLDPPDLVIACDTIYNDYLIPHFISAFTILLRQGTGILITLQLRQPDTLESFVRQVVDASLNMYYIPYDMLSEELTAGFVVYYITE